jgi:hypothetical protein
VAGLGPYGAFGVAVALKAFKTPTAGSSELLAILVHDPHYLIV